MAFTRANSLGWADGEILSAVQINQIDVNQSKAIDGAGGGTYALSAPIVLNGQSVTISAGLTAPTITGPVALSGALTVSTTLGVTGAVTLSNTLTVTGHTTFSTTMAANGNVTFNGDLTVVGTISGDVPLRLYTGTGTATINLFTYNYAIMNPSAAITLTIASGSYVRGHRITVHNRNATAGNSVAVRDPSLATIVTVPGGAKWADVVYDGTNWILARASL